MSKQARPKSAGCSDCGTTDPSLLYRSGKMSRCHDCQHYKNLSTKATGGGVHFTRDEYVAWRRKSPERRACRYCGITSADLYKLGVINVRTKRVMEVIGVDRVDNSKPYTLDNIVPCCGACNAVKGSILTAEEMIAIGPSLAKIWAARISRHKDAEPGAGSDGG